MIERCTCEWLLSLFIGYVILTCCKGKAAKKSTKNSTNRSVQAKKSTPTIVAPKPTSAPKNEAVPVMKPTAGTVPPPPPQEVKKVVEQKAPSKQTEVAKEKSEKIVDKSENDKKTAASQLPEKQDNEAKTTAGAAIEQLDIKEMICQLDATYKEAITTPDIHPLAVQTAAEKGLIHPKHFKYMGNIDMDESKRARFIDGIKNDFTNLESTKVSVESVVDPKKRVKINENKCVIFETQWADTVDEEDGNTADQN